MAAGLLGASMAQPIDDCLKTLGALMVGGHKSSPVMSSSWQPLDLLGKASGGDAKKVCISCFQSLAPRYVCSSLHGEVTLQLPVCTPTASAQSCSGLPVHDLIADAMGVWWCRECCRPSSQSWACPSPA